MTVCGPFNKNSNVGWRNEIGKVECTFGHCKNECFVKNNCRCPIYYRSIAQNATKDKKYDDALRYLKNALAMAPDYNEAWLTMANTYTMMGNHLEANKIYRKIHSIDNKNTNAMYGLISSCIDLGQFDEALSFCDECEAIKDKGIADFFREQVKEAKDSAQAAKKDGALDMALKLITHAREINILSENDHLPTIPELMVESKNVCVTILQELMKNEYLPAITWILWGGYAGIGAVHHWHVDWDGLKRKGIAETLLEPRGAINMDEYVLDSIGVGWNSEGGKNIETIIDDLALWTVSELVEIHNNGQPLEIMLDAMCAMYIFGMVYQMERLGMK